MSEIQSERAIEIIFVNYFKRVIGCFPLPFSRSLVAFEVAELEFFEAQAARFGFGFEVAQVFG